MGAKYQITSVGWREEHKGEQKGTGETDLTLIVRTNHTSHGTFTEIKRKRNWPFV